MKGHPIDHSRSRRTAGSLPTETIPAPVPLLIIGGGAAGLFAGCLAGEHGLGALILERKHKPGRKLLICGNGRCNLTKDIAPAQMLSDMGAPMSGFLAPALNACPPAALQAWFQRHATGFHVATAHFSLLARRMLIAIGGYNLTAAFASAALAVRSISDQMSDRCPHRGRPD